MYKLLAFLLTIALAMLLHALQADEEVALRALFQGKHAVNRAAQLMWEANCGAVPVHTSAGRSRP